MSYNPHFNILCHLAKIDAEIGIAEVRLIKHLGASRNISIGHIDKILKIAEEKESVSSLKDLPKQRKVELLLDLVEVIKEDDLQKDKDWNFLKSIPKKLGFNRKTLMALISADSPDARQSLLAT